MIPLMDKEDQKCDEVWSLWLNLYLKDEVPEGIHAVIVEDFIQIMTPVHPFIYEFDSIDLYTSPPTEDDLFDGKDHHHETDKTIHIRRYLKGVTHTDGDAICWPNLVFSSIIPEVKIRSAIEMFLDHWNWALREAEGDLFLYTPKKKIEIYSDGIKATQYAMRGNLGIVKKGGKA